MKTLLSALIFFLLASPIRANIIEVCPDCQVTSVKEGIRLARPCDTLIIEGGEYHEGNILIDKELTIIGRNFPILDGDQSNEIITVTANHVHLEGLQIQNVGISYSKDQAGIRIKEAQEFYLKNNRLLNTFFGIYLEKSKNGVVEGNLVQSKAVDEVSSGNAIHLWYSQHILIQNNRVGGHRDGIYLEFANNSIIAGNHSEGNVRYGLHFMFSNDDVYHNNTFRKNGAGVAVMYSKRIDMSHNVFEKNWGPAAYGLLLKEIHDSKIERNEFRENTVGIFAETSNRVIYSQNLFTQNGWALKISGGCQQNRLSENNFVSNSFDLAVHTAGSDNSFDGNFWSDYAGYDLDRDGVGDVPHRPMKLFSYVVSKTPEAMVLLRSLFVDILNFSEKVSPVFTPENVIDNRPLMTRSQSVVQGLNHKQPESEETLTFVSQMELRN